jgi:RNA polymerase sigma-70 factor (ECF subfamily)
MTMFAHLPIRALPIRAPRAPPLPAARPAKDWAFTACAGPARYATIPDVAVAPTPAATDLDLLRRIAARDDAALASFYDRHSRLAYSVILRILRSPSDAEDVLQETFVRVWSRADTYDGRLGSPAAWLTRIARNRAIDRLRARRVRSDISVERGTGPDGETVPVPEPETHETPEFVLQETVTARALQAAMADLPAAQRDLIQAAFFDGYTHPELSSRFGVPLGTVKTRIRTGLTALRGRLEQVV